MRAGDTPSYTRRPEGNRHDNCWVPRGVSFEEHDRVIAQGSPVPFKNRLAQVLWPFAALRRPSLALRAAPTAFSSRITVSLAKTYRFETDTLTRAIRRARFSMNPATPRHRKVPISALTRYSGLAD